MKVASLGVGKAVTKTIAVKLKKKAKKGEELKLTVSAVAGGEALAGGSRRVKVK